MSEANKHYRLNLEEIGRAIGTARRDLITRSIDQRMGADAAHMQISRAIANALYLHGEERRRFLSACDVSPSL